MDKTYRILLIAVCAVGILFGLQYFLPITAQLLNVKGISGIPGLPSMPTIAYEPTIATLPLVTLESNVPVSTQAGFFFFTTSTPVPGTTATITPTPVPGATTAIAPSATRSGSVGSAPRATATRTPTGQGSAPQATAIATATQSLVQEPCNNILYPVRRGNAWVYRVSSQGRSLDVTMVVATVSGQQALVDIYNQATGAASNALVICDNGAIRSFPFMQSSILSNGILSGGTIDAEYVSGILAPSEAAFTSQDWNLSWEGKYRLSGDISVPFQGQTVDLTMDNSPLTLRCRTAGAGGAAFEPITVVAGNAPVALKVFCTAESQVSGTVSGLPVSGTITGQTTQWFAGEGLLKMQVDSMNFNILGFSVPLGLKGQVELTQFYIAP